MPRTMAVSALMLLGGVSLFMPHTAGAEALGEPIVVTQVSAAREASDATTSGPASEDLRAYAHALVAGDENIHTIVLSPQKVALAYHTPAQLFGFISVQVPVDVSVNSSGVTRVSYPWYGFLLASDQADIGIRSQAAVQSIMNERPIGDAVFSTTQEVRIIDSLHTVMQEQASTTLGSRLSY